MKVRKSKTSKNSTDIALLVESTTQEEICEYDQKRIEERLITEINCPDEIAKEIAVTVTERLKLLDIAVLTTSLIRSFVNVVLFEKGFNKQLQSDSEIVISTYDIESIIANENKENGNTPHNPESINLALAELLIKQFTLKKLLIPEIRKAHLEGDIHVHDMGMMDRFYCSGHSPEYIKKHGLKNINNIPSTSNPANSAEVLARHLASATLFFTSLFAGAIGWDAVNVFFAPYLRGYTKKQYIQLAQTLLFDFSQLAGAKGGQVSFTDFNLHATIPNHYKSTFAMGKSGNYMVEDFLGEINYFKTQEEAKEFAYFHDGKILTYADFEYEAQQFLEAILEVSKKGDALGLPFGFPKLHFHINQDTFDNTKAKELLNYACVTLSETGNPYIDFDRNALSMSQCCRLVLEFDEDDKKMLSTPEEIRFVGGQNVSINLANLPLKVGKNEDDIYKELTYRMELAAKAHVIRFDYIKQLMELENSPLSFYKKGMDNKPYVKLDKISWLMGIVGLNEYVYNLIGQEMHESKEAFLKGMELIIYFNNECKRLSKKYNMNIKGEETPAESTAGRFAKLDLKKYGDKAFVQKNEYGVYYSNSVHFAVNAPIDYIYRLKEQSKFHQFIEAGSMIHNWIGDRKPDPKALFNLIEKVWNNTKCAEMTISPDKTTCLGCENTYSGFHTSCPNCQSDNVFWTTRITGYQVRVDKFNNAKLAELHDRKRENI